MKNESPTFEAINLLGLIHEKTESAEEKELLLTAAEALRFIETTGQQYEFNDYRQDLRTEGPAMVIASFATRDEAEAWLKNHPKPPHRAAVLIADEYHTVYYWRDTNVRKMPSTPFIEFYLEEMMQDGRPPPPVASFDTREQARAWFYGLSERPSQAIIQLAGEPYLAAYHRNIDHLAFHSFSLVEGLKEWRKSLDEKKRSEEPGPHS
ncbi:head protein [Vitiosangium sp. GDMCC 1.1324]|uniref:head protein n=1 Tax=Vitiosangium sp. (strain GDMCC 1.1324) TaxID=2138576 RepID=UPI0018EE67C6|nr:head protein [Vitiosangium sp. GDMCC 1.1324]